MRKTLLILFLLPLFLISACADHASSSGGSHSASSRQEEQTYAVIETGINNINKAGNVTLTTGAKLLREQGYQPGDMIRVNIGDFSGVMPIGTSYSDVDSGKMVCCFRPNEETGGEKIVLALNMGSFAQAIGLAVKETIEEDPGYQWVWAEGLDENVTVTIAMDEKEGYAAEYQLRQLNSLRSNKREDYPGLTDAEYANFREITTTGMGKGTLYRSSSPINPALNRNVQADEALLNGLVRTVINLGDSESEMVSYADYYQTSYSECDIIALSMAVDFESEEFRGKLADGLRFMISHEGPYLIHCQEGKDRTGFVAAVLECLMGADMEEITEDYMRSYTNFYGITEESEQYRSIVDKNIKTSLAKAFSLTSVDAASIDLSRCAEAYLLSIGLKQEEINELRACLSRDYGGLNM